jgi:hypothetical protein
MKSLVPVGSGEGMLVGDPVGFDFSRVVVGAWVFVGLAEGEYVGQADGASVGIWVGLAVGFSVGSGEGALGGVVGLRVGSADGRAEGTSDGMGVGLLGLYEGLPYVGANDVG